MSPETYPSNWVDFHPSRCEEKLTSPWIFHYTTTNANGNLVPMEPVDLIGSAGRLYSITISVVLTELDRWQERNSFVHEDLRIHSVPWSFVA